MKGETSAIMLVVGIVIAFVLLLLGITIYTKSFGSTQDTLDSVRSCQGLTGALTGKAAVCSATSDCSDLPQQYKDSLKEGYQWSALQDVGCPPEEKGHEKERYCCIQIQKPGYKPAEKPATPPTQAQTTTTTPGAPV